MKRMIDIKTELLLHLKRRYYSEHASLHKN